jgi:general stress protein 26
LYNIKNNIGGIAMKTKFLSIIHLIPVILLFSTSSLPAQEEKIQSIPQISRDSLLKVARTIIDSAKCRIFVTVDENGKPHAREMSPFSPENNWVIWLGTSQGSRKTKQIQHNPNVVIFYYETKGLSYVSVSGKARLVNDPDKKAKYWVDGWQNYYPDRSKNYILIEVTPEKLEICSFQYKFFWDPVTGIPASVNFDMQNTD